MICLICLALPSLLSVLLATSSPLTGLNVSNTPGAVDEATATTGVYLLIGAMRNFSQGEKHLRNGGFAPMPEVEARSSDLSGKTIGILGMGSIGVTFARMIQPFGMRILYHNRRESPSAPDFVTYVKDLDEMLEQVDVLSVNMPLSAATEGFVDERKIRKLRKGSIIINTARGKIIDEEALIKALEDGHVGDRCGWGVPVRDAADDTSVLQLAAAGLDVFATEPKVDPRLIAMPNTTLLPRECLRRRGGSPGCSDLTRRYLSQTLGQRTRTAERRWKLLL